MSPRPGSGHQAGDADSKDRPSQNLCCEVSVPASTRLCFLPFVRLCRPDVHGVARGMIALYILCIEESAGPRLQLTLEEAF